MVFISRLFPRTLQDEKFHPREKISTGLGDKGGIKKREKREDKRSTQLYLISS